MTRKQKIGAVVFMLAWLGILVLMALEHFGKYVGG